MSIQTMGSMFPKEVVSELFNKVAGHSSIAKLSGKMPLPMTGTTIFTFGMDAEANIVAESGAKSAGGITVAPVSMAPIKLEYGARVTDEFMYASEERQLEILKAFVDGAAKKFARALDIMAFHGVNPRTGSSSAAIGTNSLDTNTSVGYVTYNSSTLEDNIEDAIATLGAAYDNTGYAFSKGFAAGLGKVKVNGVSQYPEFKLGGNPGKLNGVACDVNNTVNFGDTSTSKNFAYIGDFSKAFKYGIAKEIPLEIIPYGNPDNDSDAGDLKGHNQVYLRAEIYIGWAILDGTAFARIQTRPA
ncbi:MAG: phage major capsid protein [Clostridia bacterium]|nr:phage major capsid protein [Clostridia bacterium]